MPTEKELKEIVKTYNGGKWLEYFGPHSIGTAKVWEIWTRINNTPHTRFWLEDKNGPPEYFNYFADLAAHLDETKSETTSTIEPGNLTIGQLISALTPAAFSTMVGALAGLFVAGFLIGAYGGKLLGY